MKPLSSTWSRTPRGLEILTPRPGLVRVLLLAGGAVALLVGGWVGLVAGFAELGALLAFLFDTPVLALLVPTLVLLLWFDRHSAEWAVFGGSTLVEEERVGRWVLRRSEHPLAAVASVECRPEARGTTWAVGWRRAQGDVLARPLAIGLDEAQAQALARQIQDWLAAPPPTVAVREGGLAQEWPRVVARVVAARLVTALPLAVAAGAAVALAVLWQLREAKYADAAAYDATAEGELLALQWVLSPPTAEDLARGEVQASGDLRLGVRYTAADGVARSLWWRSAEPLPVDALAELRFAPVARLLGLPAIDWVVPREAAALMTPPDGRPSFAHWPAEAPPGAEAVHAWIAGADRPLELLAAVHGAVEPDWRVAYRSEAPEQATLARLAALEAEGARGVPLPVLLLLGAIAAAFLGGGLRPAVRSARAFWILYALLLVSLPAWAAHGARIGAWFGVAQSFDAGLRGLALATGSERAGEARHQFVRIEGEPPAANGVVVRWTLAQSGAASVADLLGLAEPLAVDGDFAQRRDALQARASERIAALDDAALVDLVRRWEPEEFGRLANLRVAFVDGVCLAWRQPARSADTRRWLEWSLSNPAICDS